MNICILTHTFPKHPDDTTAAFMHPLVKGIIAAGDKVTVLMPFHQELRLDGFSYPIQTYKYIWPVWLHVLGYSQTLSKGTHFRISSYLLAPFLIFFGMIALFRITGKKNYDVICTHWILPNGIIAAVVSAVRNIPFMVTLAGSDVYVAQKNRLFAFFARWVTKKAAIICADSPQYLKELELTGARINKHLIIPYPVDTRAIRPVLNTGELRKKLNINKSSPVILSVGRLIEKKGFAVMLVALPDIIKKFPSIRYIIVGEGDSRGDLVSQAVDLGIQDHVHFVGNISRHDINTYYSLSDVVVVPSIKDHEGNIDDRPVALIEAMACGKAVVASNFPGNSLTIQQGRNGILVPPSSPKTLAEAVVLLLTSKSLRIRLGVAAMKTARTSFHYTIIGKQYHDLFQQIAASYEKHSKTLE